MVKEVEPEMVPTPIINTPAIGYSITANLGDDRQIVAQCFVAEDDPASVSNARVDRVMLLIDRQKAKYKKVEVLKNIEQMEKTLRQLKADLVDAEATFEARQKDNLAAIEKIQDEAQERGRTAPVGANAQRLEKLREEVRGAVEERKLQRQHAATNIQRFEEEIAKAKAQVAECDALIGEGG